MILLPLATQELALVLEALRALTVFGDDRDIRMNIETTIKKCRPYPLSRYRVIEAIAFKEEDL